MAAKPMEPLPEGDGHTELTEEDRLGLIPTYIATRGDLFDAEQRNIVDALRRRPPPVEKLLDDGYLRRLHRAMFGQVWAWAGTFRLREANLGVAPEQIAVAVRTHVDDTRAWIEVEAYPPDECGARFHHRLVQIHPFPNGNGRHGRVAADYLMRGLGTSTFTWGRNLQVSTADLRARYRAALQAADGGEHADLIEFCRS